MFFGFLLQASVKEGVTIVTDAGALDRVLLEEEVRDCKWT